MRDDVDARPFVHRDFKALMARLGALPGVTFYKEKPYKIFAEVAEAEFPGLKIAEIAHQLHTQLIHYTLDGIHYRLSEIKIGRNSASFTLLPDWGYWFRKLKNKRETVPLEATDDIIPI